VLDGLGPALLDQAVAAGRAPTIAALAAAGSRVDTCVSTFPSLTPVCLSAILTGAHPSGSLIPAMAWYHRDEDRMVEYGSSFAATVAQGSRAAIAEAIVNLNLLHLSPRVTTLFEDLDDAGLETAAVNTFVARGRTRHPIARPVARRLARRIGIFDAVWGPRRYFFGELFASDVTGAPRNLGGDVDRHGGGVGRWLVTRDGFDFLFFYLYETDAAQHRGLDALAAVSRGDDALRMLVDAAGGMDAFLDRYAVLVVADHSQSPVTAVADASEPLEGLRLRRPVRGASGAGCDAAVAASNRVAMVYRLAGSREDVPAIARRMASSPAADVVLLRDGDRDVALRDGGELRIAEGGPHRDERGGRWTLEGDRDLLPPAEYPNAFERIRGILGCPRAGDVVVSARAGWEFADVAGVHHLGGGSHGSLNAADSLVPLVAAGLEGGLRLPAEPSITDLAPLIRHRFGVG
jgi:hypothetical protein